MGYRRILVRTDGEPAILDLWRKVQEQWGGEIVKVESAVGEHNTNADAEQAVQQVEDDLRTWLDATNDALKVRVPCTHPLLAWMVEHVAGIHRRTYIGTDGRTPLERLRGRRGRDVFVEFAESVLYMPLRGDLSDKRRSKIELEPRFMDGIVLV